MICYEMVLAAVNQNQSVSTFIFCGNTENSLEMLELQFAEYEEMQ